MMVVNAVVLINVKHGAVNDVAEHLLGIDGIREVFSVAGRYDLVAILKAASNEAVADIVTRAVHRQDGIADTETLLAFKTYSREDLESAFGIGLEGDQ